MPRIPRYDWAGAADVDDADRPAVKQGVRPPAGVVEHGVATADRSARAVGHVTADRLDDPDGPPSIGPPNGNGGTYDGTSFIRPRM